MLQNFFPLIISFVRYSFSNFMQQRVFPFQSKLLLLLLLSLLFVSHAHFRTNPTNYRLIFSMKAPFDQTSRPKIRLMILANMTYVSKSKIQFSPRLVPVERRYYRTRVCIGREAKVER